MRTLLGALALAGLLSTLSACGDEDGVASSPDPDHPGPPASLVRIVSGPSSGEQVDLVPTPVDDPKALDEFVAPMNAALAQEVRKVVRGHDPREGTSVAAAVVAIGCDVPPSATVVEDGDAGFRVVPAKVESPRPECFVAQTSVAVVEIPLPLQ